MADYRVRFVEDPHASFEECNGEPRPLTAGEYAANPYRGCPDHWRATSVPLGTDPNVRGCAVCRRPAGEWQDIPYDEYRAYYGNPARHVYLGCVAERQCSECGTWKTTASVWSIDFMDDSPEYGAVRLDHPYTVSDALALPGYLADVAREELAEGGWRE